MQEASAKGKSAQFKGRSDAKSPDRPENLADWKNSGNGESPQAAALVNGKGTKASAKRARKAAKTEGFGLRWTQVSAGAEAGCRRERR